MNNKQNVIFFLGVTLLIVSMFVSGRVQLLWRGIFNGPTQTVTNPQKGRFGTTPGNRNSGWT